ncbi:hypothetical protein OIDMADRAFT_18214 [Oidiodendron maius Zn]|uniref:Uncharacterized protein n=1 Tax=Oidiodendron maius (strain Zn) TaxID=913774 RepID=A0A0C3CYS9_OIDMZ|nr:hypothetical protein OIDMADRAFT_18214 [Oidiodendron maius Zn]
MALSVGCWALAPPLLEIISSRNRLEAVRIVGRGGPRGDEWPVLHYPSALAFYSNATATNSWYAPPENALYQDITQYSTPVAGWYRICPTSICWAAVARNV